MTESIDLKLTSIVLGSDSVNLYSFAPAGGGALPPAEAGAHITLLLPGGLERQYSLVNIGDAPTHYTIGVKREAESRGGSAYVHDSLRVGMVVPVLPPQNHFPLVEDAEDYILIGGGIGITPIYAMAQRLTALGRRFRLYYTARSRSDAILLDEIAAWPSAELRFDDECDGQPFPLAQTVTSAGSGTHLYCCGPGGMLNAFEEAGRACGIPQDRIHVEYFAAKHEAATDQTYVVELARSKKELVVPKGKTILEVLIASGVYVSHSCSEGVCGACETTVLSGKPDHRDAILNDQEREASETMMICCSGSLSERLVLDI
ncbi:PDR/VanB family oxidoreductase [Brevundimonas guildfordensis]|uniref:Oxidoreductase n=1 Tax=Brevundimonas guildfordensis TaxID=2762241 RepID=A0ABR8QWN0_9CAUL|nr:PDR/VanB family oxidoreductase [Brevundimonas guildfordensis]MBD7939949.1 oxidoreductase [Brevundimonas guildfordensis]